MHQVNIDQQLLKELQDSLARENSTIAQFLATLANFDARLAWARHGHASLYEFSHQALHLTRSEAYVRMRLARLSRKVPQILRDLKEGVYDFSTLRILAPVLDEANLETTLKPVKGMTIRQVEDYRTSLEGESRPAMRGQVRILNAPQPIHQQSTLPQPPQSNPTQTHYDSTQLGQPPPLATTDPLPPTQDPPKFFRIAASLSEPSWRKYEQVCHLSNHSTTGGEISTVLELLFDHFLKRHDLTRDNARAAPAKPNAPTADEPEQPSRYIPVEVRRAVWKRDNGQCTYTNRQDGTRCTCRRGLQFDHVRPFAMGGSSSSTENIRLLCPAHNRLRAGDTFGEQNVKRAIEAQQNQRPSC
jgi:hypothetical protein